MVQEQRTGIWWEAEPASEIVIQELITVCGYNLPEGYIDHLRISNGGEGTLAIEPGWVRFWPAEEVYKLNQDYEIKKALPGFFGFGSNGGGELLAFKIVDMGAWPIYMIPFIPMVEKEAILIAENFELFVKSVGFEVSGI